MNVEKSLKNTKGTEHTVELDNISVVCERAKSAENIDDKQSEVKSSDNSVSITSDKMMTGEEQKTLHYAQTVESGERMPSYSNLMKGKDTEMSNGECDAGFNLKSTGGSSVEMCRVLETSATTENLSLTSEKEKNPFLNGETAKVFQKAEC